MEEEEGKENFDNSKDKSNWGGKRDNAGRPEGSKNKATLERKMAEEELKRRILLSVDRLFNAQRVLAEGCNYLYRIDQNGDKREHILITNPEEIKKVLDDVGGSGGIVDGNYYYITTKAPDNKAIDSMFDRVFGKARQNIGLDGGEEGKPISIVKYDNTGDIQAKTIPDSFSEGV
jgi:hypothetical protein